MTCQCAIMCPLLQDGCSSFDIALEVGKKIKSLQVAKCEATSEKDKKLDEKANPHAPHTSCGTGVVFVLSPFVWKPKDFHVVHRYHLTNCAVFFVRPFG